MVFSPHYQAFSTESHILFNITKDAGMAGTITKTVLCAGEEN